MYDPKLGRFISEDTIGFEGGDINLYGYVHSNPVNKTDPLGLLDPIVYQDPKMYSTDPELTARINMVSKDINRALGFPRIAGSPLAKYLMPIGTRLTPPLAVIGAGTFAYNIATDLQCLCGVID